MLTTQPKRLSIGVDYITVTTKDPSLMRPQMKLAERFLYEQEGRGNYARPWARLGFEGFACGELEFGIRQQETIIRMHGACSHRYWHLVFDRAENCSRIDFEGTFLPADGPQSYLAALHAQSVEWFMGQRRAVEPKLISGHDGPQSLYLGNRLSDHYLRSYDHFKKHKLEPLRGAVRFEAEIKGRKSLPTAIALFRNEERDVFVDRRLHRLFANRGVQYPPAPGRESSIEVPTRVCDHDQSLSWIGTQVKPTVRRLITAGKLDEVLEALGILDWCEVTPFSGKQT